MSSSNNHSYYCYYLLLMTVLIVVYGSQSSDGFGTFGFDIHHRYSDRVRGILDVDGLPGEGSVEYYAAMAHRDLLVHGRKLAGTAAASAPLTFLGGNDTYRIASLGFLHYANVSVGSPGLWFLVALDTGSSLFWLPCDCTKCVHELVTPSGEEIHLNIYSPNKSSTSTKVSCNSTFCGRPHRQCSSKSNTCAYQVPYLSNGTSSTGILVEDFLHLRTDDSRLKVVDARITFGCGIIQEGSFLDGAAPNGVFGLGMSNISVPSILANEGLAANSFSMCFGPDGIGRISFGDKGSTEQAETPFNLNQSYPSYNVSMTQVSVGDNVTDVSFSAIFDSGTSFTYLNDPAYSAMAESFNSQAQEKRRPSDHRIPFEYCYDLSANQSRFEVSSLNFTMKGGNQFHVTRPIVLISIEGEGNLYCLAAVRSRDINLIGQNFMTGYRIVFDREKMALGWEASNCYDAKNSSTLPISPSPSAIPPTSTMQPEASPISPSPSAIPPTAHQPEASPNSPSPSPIPPTAISPSPSAIPPTAHQPEASPISPPSPSAIPPTAHQPEASPISPSSTASPPTSTVKPEASPGGGNGSPNPSPSPPPPSSPASDLPHSSSLFMVVLSLFGHYYFCRSFTMRA